MGQGTEKNSTMLQKNHPVAKAITMRRTKWRHTNIPPALISLSQPVILPDVVWISTGNVSNMRKDRMKLIAFIPRQARAGAKIRITAPKTGPKTLASWNDIEKRHYSHNQRRRMKLVYKNNLQRKNIKPIP